MILFEALGFLLVFTTALSAPPQTSMTDVTYLKVPKFLLDGRKDCGLEKFLSDNNLNYNSCDIVLPIDTEHFYKVSPATLCFGIFDTLYELCKYQDLSSFEIPHYPAAGFCKKAKKSLDNYNFVHRKQVFQEWVPHLRTGLGAEANCTDICCHGTEVNPSCAVIVAALERIPAAMSAHSHSNVTNMTKSPDAKANSPSAFQRPPTPTKGSVPVPSVAKAPSQPEPAAEGANTKIDDDETAKANPPADKTAPQTEAVKPGQETKTDSKPPLEPNIDNPEFEAGMADPGAMEDDDGPGMEGQQPDIAPEQQPDLTNAKDAPNETKFPGDEPAGKQDNHMAFPGESPYLAISKEDSEETNMVTYFVLMTGGALLFYIGFHNKNKLLALALEGRRTGRRGGRHSSAAYSKLHSNLEETIASGPTSPSATHVLY